jgi:flagellar biosynthetic protein FliQ
MEQEMVIKLAKDAFQVTLMVAGPMLIASLITGVAISILQVVTSIQDMTLTFIPKIVVVFLVFLFAFPWIMHTMISYASRLFGNLETFAR